ncbi:hypothetical protein [Croceivirga radicis]|uniref:DUF4258 domain-containing protein n=1 Tax=Croceivirga radicis TaxID=1929488 RepID=A0A1V6LS17_9FLAO|nr:hypothetical protein [Croceivirga radicis]OQD42909.1 hypothetical protein BUL40_07385 [Croceivirga radicis]
MFGFIKRLGWYLVGLSIGLVFFVFILKQTSGGKSLDFCYLPNCRVLKDIRSKTFVYEDNMQQFLANDSIAWKAFFEEGNVDFGASDTKAEPCKFYIIENDKGEKIKATNCKDKVTINKP